MDTKDKRQAYAEAYGAGDVNVGRLTGSYPNAPIVVFHNPTPSRFRELYEYARTRRLKDL